MANTSTPGARGQAMRLGSPEHTFGVALAYATQRRHGDAFQALVGNLRETEDTQTTTTLDRDILDAAILTQFVLHAIDCINQNIQVQDASLVYRIAQGGDERVRDASARKAMIRFKSSMWAIILIAKNPAQEWSSTKLPWIAKRAREIIKEFEGDEVIAQSQNHDAATTIDELLKNLLAIEVHATCYAANFETATDIANYSLVVHARLGKMQITLGIVYGEEQKYRQSVWESQSHERMLDAIHTRNMLHAPGGQIAANALHDKASKAHACALQAVDRLAEMGVEGDLRRAAELIDHAKRRAESEVCDATTERDEIARRVGDIAKPG